MNRRASAPLASLQRLLGDGRAGGKLNLIHLAPGVRPAGNFGPPPLMGVRIGGIELIVKTSPRFTVNWPALASSILEDSGPVFTNRRCGGISPVRTAPDPPASTAPRARGDKKSRSHDECE